MPVALLVFFVFNLALVAASGVRSGGDTGMYLDGAQALRNGQPLSVRQPSYAAYIAVIAFVQSIGAGLTAVVAAQVIAATAAAALVARMAAELAGPTAAVTAVLLFAIDVDTNRWHAFILSDSFYLSALTIAVWLVYRAQGARLRRSRAALAIAALLVTSLIRPEGWFVWPAAAAFWIAGLDVAPARRWLTAATVIAGAGLLLAIVAPRLSGNLSAVGPGEMLQRGQTIWEYDGWRVAMPGDPILESGSITSTDAARYALRHPISTLTLMTARVGVHFAHIRPYFSTSHNLVVAAWLIPIYLLAARAFWTWRQKALAQWVLVVIATQTLVVALTHADWDGRYLAHVLPLMYPFAAAAVASGFDRRPDPSTSSTSLRTSARPGVLAILPGLFPSTIIGVAKPLLRLHQDERITLDLTLQYLVSRRTVERADVVVMCHTIDPTYAQILDWARDLGRPLIYEIDDDLLAIPEEIPGLAYLRDPERQAVLMRCIEQASVVRVYSPALQQKLSTHNRHVTLVSGPLDWSLMPSTPPRPDPRVIKMVYATGRLQDRIGLMLAKPLAGVLDRHANVELTIWGPRLEPLASHPRVRSLPLIRDYDTFFKRFAEEGFDIGLAPLPDDEFHRGKSNNKFREYASCGIAGVYSDTTVYHTSVEHERTGLLVPNQDEAWTAAIERLVQDALLRRAIGHRAREYARAHFNEQLTDDEWMSAIARLDALPKAKAAVAAGVGEAARSAEKMIGLARFGGRLSTKIGPVLRQHGAGEVLRRIWIHVIGFGQLLSWELQRWRLQRQISAQRGRS